MTSDAESSSVNPASRPNNYRYLILIACFLIMVIAYGSQASFGVFFKPMLTEFGWSRAETSGPFALYMLVSGILSFVSGSLSDKFGARKVVTAGGIIIGLGYLLTSRITGLWQLYLFYGVIVASGVSAMYVPPVSLLARWFTKRRGLMSGIGISGIGFGIGIIPVLASYIIEVSDWRTAILIVGSICLVSLVVIAQFLKPSPETLHPPEIKAGTKGKIPSGSRSLSLRQAAVTRQFWLIFCAWIFYGFFFQVGIVHIVPYATDLGMAATAAATVLTTIGLVGTVGRMGLGFVGDRAGHRITIWISFALIGLGFLGLAASNSIWMLYVFAVIFGSLSGIGVLIVPMLAEYYGFKELGAISGAVVLANCVGGAISPPLAGRIFDITGEYFVAFLICGILGLAAGLSIWLMKPIKPQV